MFKSQDIFERLKQVRKADSKKIEELRTWLIDSVEELKKGISTQVEAKEWEEDPITYADTLLSYHGLNAGLTGLLEAVYDRAMYLEYIRLKGVLEIEVDGVKSKVTQGDRQEMARGDLSDLRGLKLDLEMTQKNLYERIIPYRQSKRY